MSAPSQVVLTPTVGRLARRSLYWVGAALLLLLIAVVSLPIVADAASGPPLSSTNPGPAGAMAVAEVLRAQGVEVIATSSLDATRTAIADRANTTLFLYDEGLYLDDSQVREAVGLADRVIIVDATFGALNAVAPGIAQAGLVSGRLDADCPVTAVQNAERITATGTGYRVIDDTIGATRCLGSGDGVYSLIELPADQGTLTLLGATGALSNEGVITDGNAAFALTLLGATERLVWYLPTLADVPVGGPLTFAELTPGWASPVMVLLVLTFIAAAVWRGRRFGPLVIENLPVTVRASETMNGRARLYEKSSARLRALDALRIGTIGRLGAACGLPRIATVDEVVVAAASVARLPVPRVRATLVDAVPRSDADLVRLSDELLALERTVAASVRPH